MVKLSDNVTKALKTCVLEYALKFRKDDIVKKFALKTNEKFSSFKSIRPILFSLYQIYVYVKNKDLEHFKSIKEFLERFSNDFPNVIDEIQLKRVIGVLKVYIILYTSKIDKNKALDLLDEYIPRKLTNDEEARNENRTRIDFEKMLLLSTKFQQKVEQQIKAMHTTQAKLLKEKICHIMDTITSQIKMSKIEQLIQDQFQNSLRILFDSHVQLTTEDKISLSLFIDKLRQNILDGKNDILNGLYEYVDTIDDSNYSQDLIASENLSFARGLLFSRTNLSEDDKTVIQNVNEMNLDEQNDIPMTEIITDDEDN